VRLAATLGAAALMLGLAACGGDDDAAGDDRLSTADVQRAGVRYAECMRERGFDVPDPKPGLAGARSLLIDDDQRTKPGYRQAAEECRRHLEGLSAQISDEQRAQIEEARLEFARCMRDEGFDVPDPRPGQGPDGQGGLGDLDLDDPRVAAAMDKCRPETPALKGDGG